MAPHASAAPPGNLRVPSLQLHLPCPHASPCGDILLSLGSQSSTPKSLDPNLHEEKPPSLRAGVMRPMEEPTEGWGTPGHHCRGRGYPRAGLCDQHPNTGGEHPFHPHAAGFEYHREAGQPPASLGSPAADRGPQDRGSPLWGTSGWPPTVVVRPGGLSKRWAGKRCPMKQNAGAYLLNTRFPVASIPGSTRAPRSCRGKRSTTNLRKSWSFPKTHLEHQCCDGER